MTHDVQLSIDGQWRAGHGDRGFRLWRRVSAYERSKILRTAATIIRTRIDDIARRMTLEQGKPLVESYLNTKMVTQVGV